MVCYWVAWTSEACKEIVDLVRDNYSNYIDCKHEDLDGWRDGWRLGWLLGQEIGCEVGCEGWLDGWIDGCLKKYYNWDHLRLFQSNGFEVHHLVGNPCGWKLGLLDGWLDGLFIGCKDGSMLGLQLGFLLGEIDGCLVGCAEGCLHKECMTDQ